MFYLLCQQRLTLVLAGISISLSMQRCNDNSSNGSSPPLIRNYISQVNRSSTIHDYKTLLSMTTTPAGCVKFHFRAKTGISLITPQVAQAVGNHHIKECMGNFKLSPNCGVVVISCVVVI